MSYTISNLKFYQKNPEYVWKSTPLFVLKELIRIYSKSFKNIEYVLVEMKCGKQRPIEIQIEIQYLENILKRYLNRHKFTAHISCKFYFDLLAQYSSEKVFKKEISYFGLKRKAHITIEKINFEIWKETKYKVKFSCNELNNSLIELEAFIIPPIDEYNEYIESPYDKISDFRIEIGYIYTNGDGHPYDINKIKETILSFFWKNKDSNNFHYKNIYTNKQLWEPTTFRINVNIAKFP